MAESLKNESDPGAPEKEAHMIAKAPGKSTGADIRKAITSGFILLPPL
jgi:hypothetical protein